MKTLIDYAILIISFTGENGCLSTEIINKTKSHFSNKFSFDENLIINLIKNIAKHPKINTISKQNSTSKINKDTNTYNNNINNLLFKYYKMYASKEMREYYLGMNLYHNLSNLQIRVLEIIAMSGNCGIIQNKIASELGLQPQENFCILKQLSSYKLIIKKNSQKKYINKYVIHQFRDKNYSHTQNYITKEKKDSKEVINSKSEYKNTKNKNYDLYKPQILNMLDKSTHKVLTEQETLDKCCKENSLEESYIKYWWSEIIYELIVENKIEFCKIKYPKVYKKAIRRFIGNDGDNNENIKFDHLTLSSHRIAELSYYQQIYNIIYASKENGTDILSLIKILNQNDKYLSSKLKFLSKNYDIIYLPVRENKILKYKYLHKNFTSHISEGEKSIINKPKINKNTAKNVNLISEKEKINKFVNDKFEIRIEKILEYLKENDGIVLEITLRKYLQEIEPNTSIKINLIDKKTSNRLFTSMIYRGLIKIANISHNFNPSNSIKNTKIILLSKYNPDNSKIKKRIKMLIKEYIKNYHINYINKTKQIIVKHENKTKRLLNSRITKINKIWSYLNGYLPPLFSRVQIFHEFLYYKNNCEFNDMNKEIYELLPFKLFLQIVGSINDIPCVDDESLHDVIIDKLPDKIKKVIYKIKGPRRNKINKLINILKKMKLINIKTVFSYDNSSKIILSVNNSKTLASKKYDLNSEKEISNFWEVLRLGYLSRNDQYSINLDKMGYDHASFPKMHKISNWCVLSITEVIKNRLLDMEPSIYPLYDKLEHISTTSKIKINIVASFYGQRWLPFLRNTFNRLKLYAHNKEEYEREPISISLSTINWSKLYSIEKDEKIAGIKRDRQKISWSKSETSKLLKSIKIWHTKYAIDDSIKIPFPTWEKEKVIVNEDNNKFTKNKIPTLWKFVSDNIKSRSQEQCNAKWRRFRYDSDERINVYSEIKDHIKYRKFKVNHQIENEIDNKEDNNSKIIKNEEKKYLIHLLDLIKIIIAEPDSTYFGIIARSILSSYNNKDIKEAFQKLSDDKLIYELEKVNKNHRKYLFTPKYHKYFKSEKPPNKNLLNLVNNGEITINYNTYENYSNFELIKNMSKHKIDIIKMKNKINVSKIENSKKFIDLSIFSIIYENYDDKYSKDDLLMKSKKKEKFNLEDKVIVDQKEDDLDKMIYSLINKMEDKGINHETLKNRLKKYNINNINESLNRLINFKRVIKMISMDDYLYVCYNETYCKRLCLKPFKIVHIPNEGEYNNMMPVLKFEEFGFWVPITPWSYLNGEINIEYVNKISESMLDTICNFPGISITNLCQKYPILSKMQILFIISILIIDRKIIRRKIYNTFSQGCDIKKMKYEEHYFLDELNIFELINFVEWY